MSTPVRTLVAFTDNKHKDSIPDLVLYINTDTNLLCFNKEGTTYVIELVSSNVEPAPVS